MTPQVAPAGVRHRIEFYKAVRSLSVFCEEKTTFRRCVSGEDLGCECQGKRQEGNNDAGGQFHRWRWVADLRGVFAELPFGQFLPPQI